MSRDGCCVTAVDRDGGVDGGVGGGVGGGVRGGEWSGSGGSESGGGCCDMEWTGKYCRSDPIVDLSFVVVVVVGLKLEMI